MQRPISICVILLLLVFTEVKSNSLDLPAFCRQPGEKSYRTHPLKFPELHIPWVWEATHDPVTQNVDVTFILSSACHFNQTRWLELSARFPQYGKFFSYGKKENLLVDAPADFQDSFVENLLEKQLGCIFYKDNKMIANVKSVPFDARRPYMGPMLIRCPTNGVGEFDSMQIEVEPPKTKYTTLRTEMFPVCSIPLYQPEHKQYNLSIVTATSRDDGDQLVEWIEYHLLLGVDHLFVYNTAPSHSETQVRISKVLYHYFKKGLVTEVLWPYKNCLLEGMAKGRYTRYLDANGVEEFFKPPCPIAAYGAHASAYARFRHTSKYISYVDDDEFLSLTNQLHAHEYNIRYVADHIFARHPQAPSIAFMPIAMNSCPVRDADAAAAALKESGGNSDAIRTLSINDANMPEHLPRVYHKKYGRIGRTFEYKQVLRTDVVAFFSVHYLGLLESQLNPQITSGTEPFFVRIQHGAVLHYQTPAQESGDPFSYVDPLPIEVLPQVSDCHSSVDMRVTLYPENVVQANAVGFYSQKVLNHLLPPHLYDQLRINFRDTRKEIGL